MNIEEAIHTAIKYETKVRDLYVDAMKETNDEKGRRFFQTMAKEEQGHLDYLNDRLKHWEKSGELDIPDLGSVVPSKLVIDEGIKKLEKTMSGESRDTELELVQKALDAETETSNFYKKVVDELPAEGKKLFSRFLEIEEGHLAIVQAELDALSGVGFWFDFSDISLERG